MAIFYFREYNELKFLIFRLFIFISLDFSGFVQSELLHKAQLYVETFLVDGI